MDIKNILTTLAAWVTVVGGSILGAVASGALTLPETVVGIITTVVAVGVAITQFFTGKNFNGSKKTVSQLEVQKTAQKK